MRRLPTAWSGPWTRPTRCSPAAEPGSGTTGFVLAAAVVHDGDRSTCGTRAGDDGFRANRVRDLARRDGLDKARQQPGDGRRGPVRGTTGRVPTSVISTTGYGMWYAEATGPGPRSEHVGYAESTDGVSWTRRPDPVLGPSELPGAWDNRGRQPIRRLRRTPTTCGTRGRTNDDGRRSASATPCRATASTWTKHRDNPVSRSADGPFSLTGAPRRLDLAHVVHHFTERRS